MCWLDSRTRGLPPPAEGTDALRFSQSNPARSARPRAGSRGLQMSFGSLFKILARDTKEAFGATRPGATVPAEPLKLRLGGFVEIDTLPYRMLAGRANFELEQCAQPIAARGVVDLNRSWLHRYYFDDDETWLQ